MGKIKRNIVEAAMYHHKIVLLIVGCLIAFGVYGLIQVNKNEFPDFTIRQGLVIAVYPGASPEQVEEEVTKPLEDYIFSYKEVRKDRTKSVSRNGLCIIQVELNDDFNDRDIFWSKFKLGMQDFKSKLPGDVVKLIVKDDFGDTSALLITMESEEKTYRELYNYLSDLQDSLRLIESVGRMNVYGMQKEQISVYFDSKKLSQYGISDSYIAVNMMAAKFSTNASTQNGDGFQRPIYVSRSLNQVRDVEEMIIYNMPNGINLRIKDVAKVVREYPKNQSFITNNGKRCLVLSVEMKKGRNITQMGEKIYKTLDKFEKTLPQEVSVFRITDQTKVVSDSVVNFLKEILIAIVAVMLVVIILMPVRVAQVSAMTIPMSIFISLAIFYAFGIELNTVTLAALITTLGLIVDDAIVIIDNHVDLLGEGHSRWYSATKSATMFTKSILTATLAISITFFPFLICVKGIFHDFLLTFPWAICIVLFVSFFMALLVVPFLQYIFIRKPLAPRKIDVLGYVQKWYDKLIDICFAHPRLTFLGGILSVVLGILLFTTVKIKIMPNADRDQFPVEIYLPTGTALNKTCEVADSVERILRKDKRVVSVASFKGLSSPRFQASYAPKFPGSNYAQFVVNTTGNNATAECVKDYKEKLAAAFPEAYVRVKQLAYNSTDYPVEVRIVGSDMEKMLLVNDSVLDIMRNMDELLLVQSDIREPLVSTTIKLNQDHAARMNIDNNDIKRMLTMRYYSSGLPIGTVWNGDYDMEVKLIGERADSASLKDIEDELVPVMLGKGSVPVRQIADVVTDWHQGMISHRAGLRTITVMADIKPGLNATKICHKLEDRVEQLKMPAGVTATMGGETADNKQTIPQLAGALAISVVMIFFILLWHFKRISTALLILGSLVLCIFGTAFGIVVQGVDFSLTCFLGIISLMGIMVRNSVIMYDYAHELQIEKKISPKEAIYESAKRRMRPIFLTSAAASMGVVPMILGKSSLWMPMGAVICYGALTTMVFILTVLPITYSFIYNKEKK